MVRAMEGQSGAMTLWQDARCRLVRVDDWVLKFTSREFEREFMQEVSVMWRLRGVAGA